MRTIGSKVGVIETRRVLPPPKRAAAFYHSPEWLALIKSIIAHRGRRCEDSQCPTPRGPWGRIFGDHINELRDGGAPLDPANVMLRCSPCHGRKTAQAAASRRG
jgi:5-methylcytosine-specific restriction endonuclease McrA